MLRRWTAALMLASAAAGIPNGAVCAWAQAADSFQVVPRPPADHAPSKAAWACAIAGAGLIAASFPLSNLADDRYAEYLAETDPNAVEDAYHAAQRADRFASASLLVGEALIVTAVWLRFVRRPRPPAAIVVVLPDRCAIQLRF
jgi:hypothetical protein